MSDAPAPTRAEEGRETQCATVPEWVPVYLADRERALRAEAEVAQLRERVATLEAALRPFAKSGELFSPRDPDDYDQAIYTPAAGQEYSLCGDHLRAARTALEAPHADNRSGRRRNAGEAGEQD